jgi:hypothetical protein
VEKNYIMRSLIICIWGKGEAYKGFCWANLRERDHLGYPGVDGRIILRRIFKKWDVEDGLDRDGSG